MGSEVIQMRFYILLRCYQTAGMAGGARKGLRSTRGLIMRYGGGALTMGKMGGGPSRA